jgi:hypothetical protein
MSDADATDHVQRLEECREALADARDAVAEYGEERLEAVTVAHDEATTLLDRYEGRATGTGDFKAFVEFQESFVELVEGLDDDLPAREAFEAANDILDQRRLSEGDFERAREELQEAADLAALLEEREAAERHLRQARHDARNRLRDLEDEIERLERVRRLGEADLAAPVDRLRDPITTYNERVREAWETFRREASAREVFRVVDATTAYPLVEFRQPPDALREFVEEAPAGTEPIPTLLSYADYSRSKLAHYVDDPGELQARVSTDRTYLERLDADPLTVSWPPPSAATLRYRASELVSVVGRFAPDDIVEAARELRELPDEVAYERLREAALARQEVSDAERERLESGAVEADLEAAREERDRLTAALDD